MNSIVETIYRHNLETPDKTAVIAEDMTVNYAQLWNYIKSVSALIKNEISRGDRVLVESNHTVEFLACCYGVHLAGGVHVPFEARTPDKRIQEIADELSAALIIKGEHPLAYFDTDMASLKPVDDSEVVFPEREMLAEILFTTGTTGKSKGVMVTHNGQMNMAETCNAVLNYSKDNLWLIPTPMNHAAGLRKTHMSLVHGSSVLLLKGFTNVKRFFECIRDYHVTSIYLPPSAVHYILALAPNELGKYKDQLDFLYSSSAAMPQVDKEKLMAQLPDTRMFDAYGGSEVGAVCYIDFNHVTDKKGAVGKPNPGVDIWTTDENHVPIQGTKENPGIIAIRSNTVMAGYWGEPELTKATIQDGILYMSDLGYIGEDGYLYLIGRAGDVINVGGYKVAPVEVEDVALRFENINACACIPYQDKMMGTAVKMYIETKDGNPIDVKELSKFIGVNLEAYKIPKRFEYIDTIPMTFNGKIDRKKLIAYDREKK